MRGERIPAMFSVVFEVVSIVVLPALRGTIGLGGRIWWAERNVCFDLMMLSLQDDGIEGLPCLLWPGLAAAGKGPPFLP